MTTASAQWEFPPYTKTIHRNTYLAIDPTNPANSAAGKVVLVTGGGAGVGKSIANAFVQAGAKAVVILGRRENILTEAKAELEKSGSSDILTFVADVTDKAALDKAFEGTEQQVGKVDVVVGNAGFLSDQAPAAKSDVNDWWKAFEINIKGTFLTFQAFVEHASSSTPTFISLNTGAAHLGAFPNFSSYGASKIGQGQLVAFLQAENPDIRVVSFHPGVIASEMNVKSGLPFVQDDLSLPGSFAVWLASPSASWVGGRFLWSHWDVDELAKMKDEIVEKNELVLGLQGWPKAVEPVIVW